jgi:hypothetical protein
VTVRPADSMISVRMKSPGWGGFLMGIVVLLLPSDNLPVQDVDSAFDEVDAECQAVIGGHAQTPCAFTVAGQSVDFP